MAKADRELPLIYKAWSDDRGETEANAREYGAIDVMAAAKLWASHAHRHRDAWEWAWPITVRVREPSGATWDVEVEREMVPEFWSGKLRAV